MLFETYIVFIRSQAFYQKDSITILRGTVLDLLLENSRGSTDTPERMCRSGSADLKTSAGSSMNSLKRESTLGESEASALFAEDLLFETWSD